MGTRTSTFRNEPRTVQQTSAKAAGICPACIGAGRITEPNGDSNACTACDGTGAWHMYDCLVLNVRRVR